MLHNFDHIKAYWMIQGLKVCQVALQFGADDMDGTHGSTDEEMIYHTAGTQSGQYVDDREFRRLIEEAGYVPVRRNSTYDEFPWDWTPPSASANWWVRNRDEPALRTHQVHQRSAGLCRVRRRRDRLSGNAARRRSGAAQRDAAERRPRREPDQRLYLGARHSDELVLLPDLCIGARDEVVSVVLVSATPPDKLGGARVFVTSESASGRNLLRVILERRYGVARNTSTNREPFARACEGDPTLLIGDSAIDAIERFPAANVYDFGRLWHEWTEPADGLRGLGGAPRRVRSAIRSPCVPACTR